MPRCKAAKRQSLLQAAGQLGSEAAKFFVGKFVKLFGLPKRKLLLSPQRTLPNKTIDNCFMRGLVELVSELERTYKFKRGVQKYKNSDRATECAMTDVCDNFLKIACLSGDNKILSPKNLLKKLQEDLSLNAQDDENYFFTVMFSGMHRSSIGRSALLCRHETNSLANSSSTPSPAVLKLINIR